MALLAGVLADCVDRRRLMVACDLGRAALVLSAPVAALSAHLSLVLLYAVVGLTGVLTVLRVVQVLLPAAPDAGPAGAGWTAQRRRS